jgi:hypothetical protein
LTSYVEIAALFSETAMRPPDPEVRAGVFRQINALREEQRRATSHGESFQSRERPAGMWRSPQPASMPPGLSVVLRLWRIASPFAAGSAAVLVVLAVILLASERSATTEPPRELEAAHPVFPPDVPTAAVPVFGDSSSDFPPPIETKVIAAPPPMPVASVSAVGSATSSVRKGVLFKLSQPTPVFEYGDPDSLPQWHVVRDPAFGYMVSYPPNWWTFVDGNSRYFYPWGAGGMRHAPYWIDIEVKSNPEGLTAETANQRLFGGSCELVRSGTDGTPCLRRTVYDRDRQLVQYELHGFDPKHIYTLRLNVPKQSQLGDFQERWNEAQSVFTRMSQTLSLAQDTSASPSGYNFVLFLNGTDLWMVGLDGVGARPVTRGYMVRSFAKSPDLHYVAFTTTADPNLMWGRHLYLAQLEPTNPASPTLLWSNADVYDLAWYSERELLAIASSEESGPGIYRLTLDRQSGTLLGEPELLTALPDELVGARGLAVAPDRQLITFLAPLGENRGTNIYAVRPDGTDLIEIVSHTYASAPYVGDKQALTAANQAIKSYVWLEGRLEYDGYIGELLFTCGDAFSPTLYRGGFLYSASRASGGPLLAPEQLRLPDAHSVRIVHVAYFPPGKVAFTGFYNYRDLRAEVLAGLWTANLDPANGTLTNVRPQPVPDRPNGIADLEWSPDGQNLIYRETFPISDASLVSRYEGNGFRLVKQDVYTGQQTVLYDASRR